jgi:hypothetical protein
MQRQLHTMAVLPVSETEIISIIKNLSNGSPGWDGIAPNIVKNTHHNFIKPFSHVMNLSITEGVFPTELKIARVIPLFKSGDPMVFSNYRPVSVLPLFSKILERLMYNRLLSFVNKYDLLYKYQFGFRPKHSPELALVCLVEKISNALENGDYVLGLFLDFSKAFDTVNHEILLSKLDYLGVRGVALKWFESYLSQRSQHVVYNDVASSSLTIKCGVPQGSILGPLLFLLYINDLAGVSNCLFSLLFADDSNMFITGKNLDDLISTMNTEMAKIVDWLNINKLSLNLKKTHYMVFRKPRCKISLTSDLIIGGMKIDMATETKFLGVKVDQHLTFESHIRYMKQKISRGIGILYKAKRLVNETTLLTLYHAFLYPYFTYCITVWGNTYNSVLDSLVKLQKHAVRIVIGAKKYSHTAPIFNKLGLLDLHRLYLYSVQLFVYKYHHELLPCIFTDYFTINSSVHEHNTRQRNKFHVPITRSAFRARSLRWTAVKLHNYFFDHIDLNVSYATYKSHLRKHILSTDNII